MMIMMKVDDDDDDGCCQCIVMKVILVKEVMSCDVLPVAIYINLSSLPRLCGGWSQTGRKFCRRVFGSHTAGFLVLRCLPQRPSCTLQSGNQDILG